MRRLAGLLALLLAAPLVAQNEAVYVGLKVTPQSTVIGGRVSYQAFVTVQNIATEEIEVVPPSFTGFTVPEEPHQETDADAQRTVFEFRYDLEPQTAGRHVIEPFRVKYTDQSSGQPRQVESERVTIRVDQPDLDEDIRGHRPPVEVPDMMAPYRRLSLFLGLLLAGCLAMSGVAWLIGRLAARNRVAPVAAVNRVPADWTALRRLDELEREGLPAKGMVDPYHIKLSGILRDYLGERFGFHAAESTTSEIVGELYRVSLSDTMLRLARQLLAQCDRVKFADFNPSRERMEELLPTARALIEQTKAEPEAER